MEPLNSVFNRDFQIRLLRHLYHDDKFYRETAHIMNYEDFELPACRVIFEALKRYRLAYDRMPIFDSLEAAVIHTVLNRDGKSQTTISQSDQESLALIVQGLQHIAPLDTEFYRRNLGEYLKTVRVNKILADKTTSSTPWNGSEIIQEILKVNESTSVNTEIRISSMSGDPDPVLNEKELAKIKTGITMLDACLVGGLGAGETGLVVGITGLGKTNTLLNFQYAATMVGWCTLFITLELTEREIKHRWNCIAAHIAGKWVHKTFDKWPEEERNRINMIWGQENRRLRYDSLYEPPRGTKVNVQHISEVIAKWKDEKVKAGFPASHCRGVYIDWLDQLDKSGSILTRNTRSDEIITDVMSKVCDLARKHDVALWTATQATSQASGKVFLDKVHTSQAFHKLDNVDVAIGLGLKEDRSNAATSKDPHEIQMFDPNVDSEIKEIETRRVMSGSVMKNRRMPPGTNFVWYQGPTLRYFDNEHQANSVDSMIEQKRYVEALGI